MTNNNHLIGLLDRIQADVDSLRVALNPDVHAADPDAVARALASRPYPYRAWGLYDALRKELPGITTKQIHELLRSLGFYKTRDQVSIIWKRRSTPS
jgi:hypothetical protein